MKVRRKNLYAIVIGSKELGRAGSAGLFLVIYALNYSVMREIASRKTENI